MVRLIIHIGQIKQFTNIDDLISYSNVIQKSVLDILINLKCTNVVRLYALNCIIADILEKNISIILNHQDVISIEYDKQIKLFKNPITIENLKNVSSKTIKDFPEYSTYSLVCLIGSGVDSLNPALQDNYSGIFKDFVNTKVQSYDDYGQGTHLMGIICGKTVDNIKIGINPNSKWMAVKVVNKNGVTNISTLAQALEWCYIYSEKKPDIINISIETNCNSNIISLAIQNCIDAGICIISGSGNSGPNNIVGTYPALYNGVFVATACDTNNNILDTMSKGDYIDFTCPGTNILSVYKDNQYGYISGSEQAGAYLCGLVSLMLMARRSISTYNKINQITLYDSIKYTCTDIGPNIIFGNGLVNVENSINKFILTATIIEDDFSSLDFNGGTGWDGPWTITENVIIENKQVKCMNHGSFIERKVDLTNMENANILFWTKKTNWYSSSVVTIKLDDGLDNWTIIWENKSANGRTGQQDIIIPLPKEYARNVVIGFGHYDYYGRTYNYNWLFGETFYTNIQIK